MSDISCPIWNTEAEALSARGDGQDADSLRAGGRYFVADTASAMLKSWDESKKIQLTSWLVEQRRLGVSCPEISSTTLEEVTKMRRPSVHDRADSLLGYLGTKSDLLGTVVELFNQRGDIKSKENEQALLAWTASRKTSEVVTLAEYCSEEGWIEYRKNFTRPHTDHELMLRPPGYARLAELDGINPGSKQAFVAMWFARCTDDAYEKGIEPAIREAGYKPLRIDRTEHNNKIDDEIIAAIKRSRFLVADFTQGESGARGGVYYEAGFAHGLNIPVIFTCQEDAIGTVHFDTRQDNHITWKTPEELQERLAQRISATIGDGPLKEPG